MMSNQHPSRSWLQAKKPKTIGWKLKGIKWLVEAGKQEINGIAAKTTV